jgi:hypothetical protein
VARYSRHVAEAIDVVVDAVELPGLECKDMTYKNIHVGVCDRAWRQAPVVQPSRPWGVRGLVPGDAAAAKWELEIVVKDADGELDFGGHFVRGTRGDRHIGLAWGEVPGDGSFRLFRGAKLRLDAIDREAVLDARTPGKRLVARLGLTDEKGHPRCASVRPPAVTWSTERA